MERARRDLHGELPQGGRKAAYEFPPVVTRLSSRDPGALNYKRTLPLVEGIILPPAYPGPLRTWN